MYLYHVLIYLFVFTFSNAVRYLLLGNKLLSNSSHKLLRVQNAGWFSRGAAVKLSARAVVFEDRLEVLCPGLLTWLLARGFLPFPHGHLHKMVCSMSSFGVRDLDKL